MAQTAAELTGPCLEKICEIANGRKYTKLRHEAKVRTHTYVTCLALQEDTQHGLTVQHFMSRRPAVHADGGGLG